MDKNNVERLARLEEKMEKSFDDTRSIEIQIKEISVQLNKIEERLTRIETKLETKDVENQRVTNLRNWLIGLIVTIVIAIITFFSRR